MDANDFWCRSFHAAMVGQYAPDGEGTRLENHGAPAAYCERAADAALAVAQRRGMVTGERTASAPAAEPAPDVLGWLAAQESSQSWGPRFGVWRPSSGAYQERRFHARKVVYDSGALYLFGDEGGPEVSFPAHRIMRDWTRADAPSKAAAQPAPERVEFAAERADHGMWTLRAPELGGSIWVTSGRESLLYNGNTIRIKWGETMPPKPIEVWLERR